MDILKQKNWTKLDSKTEQIDSKIRDDNGSGRVLRYLDLSQSDRKSVV